MINIFFNITTSRSRILVVYLFLIGLISGCTEKPSSELIINHERSFNLNWKFLCDSVQGAEMPDFDDTGWRTIDLPHDWSIEDLPGPDTEDKIGPFSKESPGTTSTGYVMGGTGWYRKHFILTKADEDKIVKIYFDGVYMESDVWVNGKHAGYHAYGYTPFYYDVTDKLNPPGQNNMIAVRVKNTGQNSRWYTGSGIYRDVKLLVTDAVHIRPWQIYITTPDVNPDQATVYIEMTVTNESDQSIDAVILTKLVDMTDKEVASVEKTTLMQSGESKDIKKEIEIMYPKRWSVESPYLYKAIIDISYSGKTADTYAVPFGIRTIDFSAEKGFLLNGQNLLLKGACMHHDNGILGSAAFTPAETRRVRIMKANGYNVIRTSHNPPSQAFLDACDRLGMLVIDESFDMWKRPKKPHDYYLFFDEWWKKDMEAMLLRDRNHPSIIIWSIGNEIPERADTSGIRIARQLIEVVGKLDPTRPVTNAICDFWDNPGLGWDATIPAFEVLDIGGYNYQWQKYESDHQQFPDRIMMGTESVAQEAFDNWDMVKKHPWVIGDFIWTGMDYFGEAGIGHTVYLKNGEEGGFAMPFPWFNAWCGDIDVCGNKKPQSYYRDVVWDNSRLNIMVHTPIPEGKIERVSFWGWPDEEMHWNWPGMEEKPMQVTVYSSCDEVRLELNGRNMGVKPITEKSQLTTKFEVPYEPGELKAVGIINGQDAETETLVTTGPPARIQLKIEDPNIRADRNDLAYFNVYITDEAGLIVPDAAIPVKIKISGSGELQAAGSANPKHMESFQDEEFLTFRGRGLIIVRPTLKPDEITVNVTADGLESASLTIQSH